jgi:hypothetical protein
MNFNDMSNINTLWDVLIDVEGQFILKNNGQYLQPIQKQFSNIVHNFYDVEKTSGMSLMTMNKKIIAVLINEWIPMLKKEELEAQKKKVQKVETTLFTAEEIQQSRKIEFEQQLNEKQNEFRSAMTQPLPNVVDFKEKTDEPIGQMEKLISETIAQRNFDINQLQNPNKEEAEKWLQSVKTITSKDNTKDTTNYLMKDPMNYKEESSGIKYIKIGEPLMNETPQVVELPTSKKQLSWATQLEKEDENYDNIQMNISDSIFSKLKPLQEPKSNIKILEGKMDALLDKMDTLIDLFAKNIKNN